MRPAVSDSDLLVNPRIQLGFGAKLPKLKPVVSVNAAAFRYRFTAGLKSRGLVVAYGETPATALASENKRVSSKARRPSGPEVLRSVAANWRIVGLGTMLATMTTVSFYFITQPILRRSVLLSFTFQPETTALSTFEFVLNRLRPLPNGNW